MGQEPEARQERDEPATERVRRPVAGADTGQQSKGRSGCLLLGAVLGIVVGAMFAAYGLPPILRHFYGEQHVAAGQTYEGDAKIISVSYAGPDPDPASGDPGKTVQYRPPSPCHVTLHVRTNKTWNPRLSDFSLEVPGAGDWLEADSATGVDAVNGQLQFPLGTDVVVFLGFSRAFTPGQNPRYLHLADPLVRFELPAPQ